MSYCQFENTYHDLKDCLDSLEAAGSAGEVILNANEYEKPYVKKLIALCKDIAENFGD